eukprot:Em0003g1508a
MLCDGVSLQTATKHCRVCGGRLVVAKKSKRTIYNSLSYKNELKLAFGIDVIVDHIEIHPPSFCKPCKLSMDRVLNASRQNKLVPFRSLVTPYKWKATLQTSVKNYTLRVFMHGDYEYLGGIYRISGASGRQPCMFCTITSNEIQKPPSKRQKCPNRSVESIISWNQKFLQAGGDAKKVKNFMNCISKPFFNIPLTQEGKVLAIEKIIKEGFKLHDDLFMKGPEVALQNIGVERQQYFGGTFVGNHIHKTLKDEKCAELDKAIVCFMDYFRTNFPNENISPKMHLLEDHTVEWVRREVFIRSLDPQSLHNGKVLSYLDKVVMATRLLPTHKASRTLGEWSRVFS